MVTHTLTQKTTSHKGKLSSTGQKITPLGGGTDPTFINRVTELETKVEEQSDKLDQITSLLNEISKKTSAS